MNPFSDSKCGMKILFYTRHSSRGVAWVEGYEAIRFVVIMAGGRGERFWPQSRLTRPKHLLPDCGEILAMLAQTVDRLEGLVPPENMFVITNVEQRDAVLESCPSLLPERVIGEPVDATLPQQLGWPLA